jgi:hypothetical protein
MAHTSFMTLDANIDNSKATQKSSSIKLSINCAIPKKFLKSQGHGNCCMQNINKVTNAHGISLAHKHSQLEKEHQQ